MKKRFIGLALLFIFAMSRLSANDEIVKTSWYSGKQQEPAVFEVNKIDPERTVVDVKIVDGMSFKRMFLYFIEENGKETVYEHNGGTTIPLFNYFISNSSEMMDKYKKIEFYLNGRKGEELFQESNAELTFRDRPFISESLKATAKRDINGRVEPALFPIEEAIGADYVWVTMDEGKKGILNVYVTNINTGKKQFIEKQTFSQINDRTLQLLPYIWEHYANDFTHLAVNIEDAASEDLGQAEGTVSIISRSLEHREKSKKMIDENREAEKLENNPIQAFLYTIGLIIFVGGALYLYFFRRRF
ncbi:MAG: hypothetical protein ACOCWW_01040 [Bacteroidota bacterium]